MKILLKHSPSSAVSRIAVVLYIRQVNYLREVALEQCG